MTLGSNRLTDIIRQAIKAQQGLISFSTYMELALYHPEFGYYTSASFSLGKQGDFTTAPEISPLFAVCFAQQCAQILRQLKHGNLLELGAGTGRFACDLLFELAKLNCLPDTYYIYEISKPLRTKQRDLILSHCPDLLDRVQWVTSLPVDFVGVILANEVLDAVPVNCFSVTSEGIKERCVTWENAAFTWKLSDPLSPELAIEAEVISQAYGLPEGYTSEINLRVRPLIESIANALQQGIILFADYGYGRREYYHPERRSGTLAGFYQHKRMDNPFYAPGAQDITAHVDFTRIIEIASDAGCTLEGFTTQASFLLACGLIDHAAEREQQLSPAELVNFHHAIKVLTMPSEMGDVIKVMALGKGISVPLQGFLLSDRRRDL